MTNTFLLNDFYSIENQTNSDNDKIVATIVLNPNHPIFKGHFEQMPIVPGVCQTQIIKEILQQTIHKNLFFNKGINIKYTGVIIPSQHPKVFIEMFVKQIENTFAVDAKLFFDASVFTKFKGEFILA